MLFLKIILQLLIYYFFIIYVKIMKITINLVLIAFKTCDNIGYVNSIYAKS